MTQGRTFLLIAVIPLFVIFVLFIFARLIYLSDGYIQATAFRFFNASLTKNGISPAAYRGPIKSHYDEDDGVQFCWTPVRSGIDKLCVIHIKSFSEINLYKVLNDPYRYVRLD